MAKKAKKPEKENKKNPLKDVEKTVVKEAKMVAKEAKKKFMQVEGAVENIAKDVAKSVSKTVSQAVTSTRQALEGKHPQAQQHHKQAQHMQASSGMMSSDGKIPFKEFSKIEMRVGKIIDVKDHPNADKLFVLTINVGDGKSRTIVAGLKEHYKKEQLKGKKVIVVCNLAHANLRGVDSEGMLLAAVSDGEEDVVFLSPESDIREGSRVR
ncbi:methionine--tRNA ligase subunit beta [Candidatus Pacearchaeota archaeon]|nr:methionine--tRNA ligase subunit beta [Candidatus Pacearchaeota archaeon]